MKRNRYVRLGIVMGTLCLLSMHCSDPNLPLISIVQPDQDAVIVEPDVPSLQYVEVNVPVPGCGATTYPVYPETFTATRSTLDDGKVVLEEDITADLCDGVPDPDTGAYTWSGDAEFPDFGEYQVLFSIENERGQGEETLTLRIEQPVGVFQGGTFYLSFSSLGQDPSDCLASQALLDLIHPVFQDLIFPVDLPSGAEILASGNAYPWTLDLPRPIPSVHALLGLDEENNDIRIDGPDDYTVDISGLLPIPGLECILTIALEGLFDDVEPYDPDGVLSGALTVEASPGGECVLIPSSENCSLILGLDLDSELKTRPAGLKVFSAG